MHSQPHTPDEGERASPGIRADKDNRSFCKRFPNSVASDPKLTASALVILAYRSTYTGSYGTNEKHLAGIARRSGWGRNVRRGGISLSKQLGYLSRPHNSKLPRVWENGRKKFATAKDALNLPSCGDADGRMLRRTWFDGTATVNELAAVIFIRAHGTTYARELAERFDWSRPTAAKVINALLARGLLVRDVRREHGKFRGTTYTVPKLSALRLDPAIEMATVKVATVKTPGNGKRGNGKPVNTRREDPDIGKTSHTRVKGQRAIAREDRVCVSYKNTILELKRESIALHVIDGFIAPLLGRLRYNGGDPMPRLRAIRDELVEFSPQTLEAARNHALDDRTMWPSAAQCRRLCETFREAAA